MGRGGCDLGRDSWAMRGKGRGSNREGKGRGAYSIAKGTLRWCGCFAWARFGKEEKKPSETRMMTKAC